MRFITYTIRKAFSLIYIIGFLICHILRFYIQYVLINTATITDEDCNNIFITFSQYEVHCQNYFNLKNKTFVFYTYCL